MRMNKLPSEAIQKKIENLKYVSDYMKVLSETYDTVCIPKDSKAFKEFLKLIERFNESGGEQQPLDLLKDKQLDMKVANAIAKINSNDPMDQLLKICSELTQEEEEIPEVSCEFLQLIPTRNSPDRLMELYKECEIRHDYYSCHIIEERLKYLKRKERGEI